MRSSVVVSAALPVDVPVEPSAQAARAAAREELRDPAYQAYEPSLFERASTAVLRWLQDGFETTAGATPGGWWSAVVLVLLLTLGAVALRARLGPLARTGRRPGAVFAGAAPRSTVEHHRAADAALSAGDLDAAVTERFRALVRGLEERGLLDPRPGRTAAEVAAEGATLFPGCAAALRAAATAFNEVRYGGRAATTEAHAAVADADRAVRAARPDGGPASLSPGWARP